MIPTKTIKHINKLQQKKYRKEYGEFIVEGIKGVSDALNSNTEVLLIIIQGNRREEKEFENIIKKAEKQNIQIEFCGRNDTDKIKTTETFPGIMAVIIKSEFNLENLLNDKPIICLDKIKDPGNVGTIIRTADWFGIPNILLSEDSVDPYNPKLVRSTMGSIFHIKIFESSNLKNTLEKLKKENGYKICSIDLKGENINKAKLNSKKTIYILGSESQGVSPELESLVDKSYTIPGSGQAESLNVAVAGGVLMNFIFHSL